MANATRIHISMREIQGGAIPAETVRITDRIRMVIIKEDRDKPAELDTAFFSDQPNILHMMPSSIFSGLIKNNPHIIFPKIFAF